MFYRQNARDSVMQLEKLDNITQQSVELGACFRSVEVSVTSTESLPKLRKPKLLANAITHLECRNNPTI